MIKKQKKIIIVLITAVVITAAAILINYNFQKKQQTPMPLVQNLVSNTSESTRPPGPSDY